METRIQSQEGLDKLENWAADHRMKFNKNKAKEEKPNAQIQKRINWLPVALPRRVINPT